MLFLIQQAYHTNLNIMKKTLEILVYLLVELGLAYLLVAGLKLDPRIIPIVGAVFVYLGKLIITKIK